MEYPHWLMVAGAVLVVLGFIGFAFRNRNGPVNESGRAGLGMRKSALARTGSSTSMGQYTPTERLEAMRESASASADSQRKAKGK
jgi:hypothetical protein